MTRQRLERDSGRVSSMRTRSPTEQTPLSACAANFVSRLTVFRYTGCVVRRSTATMTVFSILSLITRPTRVLRFAITSSRLRAAALG